MSASGGIYKWADDEGNVSYSDSPPGANEGEIVDLPPPPSEATTEEARQRLEKLLTDPQSLPTHSAHEADGRFAVESAPVPYYESSEYLETVDAEIALDWNRGEALGQFSILLRPKPSMPDGVYLEAFFEDPLHSDTPIVIGRTRTGSQLEGFITPKLKGLKCKDYWIAVYVCHWSGCIDNPRDSDPKVWSVHWQPVHSRVDTRRVSSHEEWIEAMQRLAAGGSYCP